MNIVVLTSEQKDLIKGESVTIDGISFDVEPVELQNGNFFISKACCQYIRNNHGDVVCDVDFSTLTEQQYNEEDTRWYNEDF